MIRIEEETMAVLGEYAKVSIAFTVESKYVAVPVGGADGGWTLSEALVEPAWIKDYDGGEPPTRWLRWNTTNWRIFSAFSGEVNGLAGQSLFTIRRSWISLRDGRELAALWDLRVAPEWRGRGVGTMLYKRVVRYAKSVGCVELKIETQDVNVPACDFYAKQGCHLVNVIPNAYPGWPDEVEFDWMLEIEPDTLAATRRN